MSTSVSALRRQLANANAAARAAENALHAIAHPFQVKIAELEKANKNLRYRLEESRQELHTLKVLASTIQVRASAMEMSVTASLASGNGADERVL